MFRQRVLRSSFVVALALLTAAGVAPTSDLGAQRPRFFSDDPLPRDPETQDASKVEEWEIGLTPDLLQNLFSKEGDPLEGALVTGPERIETGWWDGHDVRRDYYVALSRAGVRLWIFRERPPGQRWFLHGVFG